MYTSGNNRKILLHKSAVILCFVLCAHVLCADTSYCFRVYLHDKGEPAYMISSPEEFLSPDAINLRRLHEIFIDETDLPVSEQYIKVLMSTGVSIVVKSKWMNTIVVESADSSVIERLRNFSFVDSVCCVWNGEDRINSSPCENDTAYLMVENKPLENPYGYAFEQTAMLNGITLHEKGFKGKDMRIAVIDAGFENVDKINAFSSLNLIGTYNVIDPFWDVFCEDSHGTKVLSCMAANLRGVMTGTAPEASFLLIKSEDQRGENPIEEDYWAAAVEYADSMGINVISSSLGYFRFDRAPDYYLHDNLDGKTAFSSRIADIAAKKGILVVSSAGNEGNNEWSKVTFPADAKDVLSVGSVNSDREKSNFSSVGMTADYRIKPDIVALGTGVCVINSDGQIQYTNGTSFAAPTVTGLVACLWQAFPLLKNTEIIKLIKET